MVICLEVKGMGRSAGREAIPAGGKEAAYDEGLWGRQKEPARMPAIVCLVRRRYLNTEDPGPFPCLLTREHPHL